MIALDTNVLVRLLTEDDRTQSVAAQRFIDKHTSDAPFFLNRLVVAEIVCTLERAYHYAREQIAHAIESLLRTSAFIIEDAQAVAHAVKAYEKGADFADALISESNRAVGCETTVTFDRAAARALPAFKLIS